MLNLNCPQCGNALQIDERYAGQTGKCRQCGVPIFVPPLALAVPSSAAENSTARQTDTQNPAATPNTAAEPSTGQTLGGCSIVILVVLLFGWLLVNNINCNPGQSHEASNPEHAVTAPVKLPRSDQAIIDLLRPHLAGNRFEVRASGLSSKKNPKGAGIFVFGRMSAKRSNRPLVWLMLQDIPYPLNGATKDVTPDLLWPREAPKSLWQTTGLDPYSASEALEIVFGPNWQ